MPALHKLKEITAASLTAAVLATLMAGSALAEGSTGQESETGGDVTAVAEPHRLRAKVGLSQGGGTTGVLTLPQAMRTARDRACRRTASILWDRRPRSSTVSLTLFRQPGSTDATKSDVLDATCQNRAQRRSAFRLRSSVGYPTRDGRVVRGPMGLWYAVRVLTERANELADEVLRRGTTPTLTLRLGSKTKSVRDMIAGLARRYGHSVAKSVSVARCESGLRPRARSAFYGGVYQQAFSYWPGRARRFGHSGESIFDAYANIDVSLKMARAYGWGHWGCA
jgi:hypothetical protein